VNDYLNGRLRSRNVHSEIVFSLSPNNNVCPSSCTLYFVGISSDQIQIAESFRKFGLTDTTKDLLVVKVSVHPDITHDSVAEHLKKAVEGTPVPFNDETLSTISDVGKIRKAYKISSPATKPSAAATADGSFDDARRHLEVAVVGALALRGAS
jgi:EKC/KEOPS complex subunit CGI121/TPRKB